MSETEKGWVETILSLGSNQGNRSGWLAFAIRVISAHPHVHTLAASPVYKTEPVDVPADFQRALYFNQILICETDLAPKDFSDFIHAVEKDSGRQRGDTLNLPRKLDIDIISFGSLCQDDPELTLPHPRALSRRFVLQPLADLKPDFRFPNDGQTVAERLAKLPKKPGVTLVDARLLHTKESAKWNYPY